jgi:hypothetical protein
VLRLCRRVVAGVLLLLAGPALFVAVCDPFARRWLLISARLHSHKCCGTYEIEDEPGTSHLVSRHMLSHAHVSLSSLNLSCLFFFSLVPLSCHYACVPPSAALAGWMTL